MSRLALLLIMGVVIGCGGQGDLPKASTATASGDAKPLTPAVDQKTPKGTTKGAAPTGAQ